MSAIKLQIHYWPFAGRSLPFKVAVDYYNKTKSADKPQIDLEHVPVPFEQWEELQKDHKRFPNGDLPVLVLPDGTHIAESIAIAGAIGQMTGLWPSDPVGLAKALSALATLELIYTGPLGEGEHNMMSTMNLDAKDLPKARAMVSKRIAFYGRAIEQLISDSDVNRIAKGQFSIVDISLAWSWYLFAESFDHIRKEDVESCPKLCALKKSVFGDAILGEFIKKYNSE